MNAHCVPRLFVDLSIMFACLCSACPFSIIICDEFQNLLFHELDTLITRVGQNSKIHFAGDIAQTDLKSHNGDRAGYERFKNIIKDMEEFECVEFDFGDIIRSGLVRSYLIAKANLGLNST